MTTAQSNKARSGESGQAITLSVIAITVLLTLGAFVIDIGRVYHVHRTLQGSADAAALAGAEDLPSATNATALAHSYGATSTGKNYDSNVPTVNESVTTSCSTGAPCNPVNTIDVTETTHVDSIFARIIGRDGFTVTAHSAACSPAAGSAVLIDSSNPDATPCAPPSSLPVCANTTIGSNFNGTPIAGGRYIWFNAVVKITGAGTGPETVGFDHQVITFTSGGTTYHLTPPDSSLTVASTNTTADTSWDAANNRWVTNAPTNTSGNWYLAGFAFHVPAGGLPGGINPVTWSGRFTSTKTSGVSLQWQWAAAVYTQFATDYSLIGPKPVDDNKQSMYKNSDHAASPENYKAYVTGGARGGGGSDTTGSYTGTYTNNTFTACS
jgi:hypothetical protein